MDATDSRLKELEKQINKVYSRQPYPAYLISQMG